MTFYGCGLEKQAEGMEPLPFLVTEFLPGGTLRSLLANKDVELSQLEKEAIAFDVLRGMTYMHRRGVMHRDLKSDNVMLAIGPSGKRLCKVADLGTAVLFSSPRAQHVLGALQLQEGNKTKALSKTLTLGAGTPL